MTLIVLGVVLIFAGVVLSTLRTLRRGRLSTDRRPDSGAPRDTLEPPGRGRRLSLKADLPGIALYAIGALLIFLGVWR